MFSRMFARTSFKHAVVEGFQPLIHHRRYATAASLNQTEVAKFAAMADSW
ncbi:hypothetical protein Hanom_Chr12g01097861 [Helianthus anomalus]